MPFLGFKYAKIAFATGAPPPTHGGAYSAPPDPLVGLMGATSKGKREGGKGKGRRGKERGGRGMESCAPFLKFLEPPYYRPTYPTAYQS